MFEEKKVKNNIYETRQTYLKITSLPEDKRV